MRSAYRAIFGDDYQRASTSSSQENQVWWKVWNTDLLPRIKLFVWRLYHDALPTQVGLEIRIKGLDSLCGVCERGVESALHALKDCVMASSIRQVTFCAFILDLSLCSILDWLDKAFERLDGEGWEMFLTYLWVVWGARNKLVMARECVVPSEVCEYATKMVNEA